MHINARADRADCPVAHLQAPPGRGCKAVSGRSALSARCLIYMNLPPLNSPLPSLLDRTLASLRSFARRSEAPPRLSAENFSARHDDQINHAALL
jgi:hypothetical protein